MQTVVSCVRACVLTYIFLVLVPGTSGTGKTMMANALGNKLSKRILLINFTSLGGNQADEVIKFIFREAKLTYAAPPHTRARTHTQRAASRCNTS
jgi:MoxR-like ATPase